MPENAHEERFAVPGFMLDAARMVSTTKTELFMEGREWSGRLYALRKRQFDLIARLAEISLSIERQIAGIEEVF